MDINDFLSKEEFYFACWLKELKDKGIVKDFIFEPDSFELLDDVRVDFNKQLKTKVRTDSHKLKSSVSYTTDFKILWDTQKSNGILTFNSADNYAKKGLFWLKEDSNESYIEVKPEFDMNNMTRHVKIKIAWVYDKYDIHIDLVKPLSLFKKTFYPKRYFLTDSGKSERTKKVGKKKVLFKNLPDVKDIDQFLNSLSENNG